MITRSEGWKPQVSWSRSVNPEATPVIWSFFSKSLLEDLEALLDDRAHRHETGAHAALGEGEDAALGLVEHLLDVAGALVAHRRDLGGGRDQAAHHRLLADDARVVGDVGRRRHLIDEGRQIDGAADLLELVLLLEALAQGDQVDRLVVLEHVEHRGEETAVRAAVEILRLEDLDDPRQHRVVEQDRAEDGLLRLDVLRREPVETRVRGGRGRHGSGPPGAPYSRTTQTLRAALTSGASFTGTV